MTRFSRCAVQLLEPRGPAATSSSLWLTTCAIPPANWQECMCKPSPACSALRRAYHELPLQTSTRSSLLHSRLHAPPRPSTAQWWLSDRELNRQQSFIALLCIISCFVKLDHDTLSAASLLIEEYPSAGYILSTICSNPATEYAQLQNRVPASPAACSSGIYVVTFGSTGCDPRAQGWLHPSS